MASTRSFPELTFHAIHLRGPKLSLLLTAPALITTSSTHEPVILEKIWGHKYPNTKTAASVNSITGTGYDALWHVVKVSAEPKAHPNANLLPAASDAIPFPCCLLWGSWWKLGRYTWLVFSSYHRCNILELKGIFSTMLFGGHVAGEFLGK